MCLLPSSKAKLPLLDLHRLKMLTPNFFAADSWDGNRMAAILVHATPANVIPNLVTIGR